MKRFSLILLIVGVLLCIPSFGDVVEPITPYDVEYVSITAVEEQAVALDYDATPGMLFVVVCSHETHRSPVWQG